VRRVRTVRADRPQTKMGAVLVWTVGGLVLAFMVFPILFVIPVSFTKQQFLSWPPQLFSMRWYEQMWNSPLWLPAATRSVLVGLGSATLATIIGVSAALALGSAKMRWRPLWLVLMISPMMVPRVILAVGLFYLFAPLGLVGSSFALTLAHTALALPYVVVTVMALLKDYDHRLNQAAWTLGASRWTAFRKIQLPLIQGGIVAAFLFGFVTSFDDLTLALFVTAGLTATLPKEMWDAATMQVSPELAAVSTITLVFIVLIVLVAERLRTRSAVRRES
jgi:ABC-type spermidine/putrescine transport system permease subunit II